MVVLLLLLWLTVFVETKKLQWFLTLNTSKSSIRAELVSDLCLCTTHYLLVLGFSQEVPAAVACFLLFFWAKKNIFRIPQEAHTALSIADLRVHIGCRNATARHPPTARTE